MARSKSAKGRRTAEFLEQARTLVRIDRHNRKYGINQDFPRVVARALENAYQRGFQEAIAPPKEPVQLDFYMEWIEIPSRPRIAFDRICFSSILFSKKETDLANSVLIWDKGRFGVKPCWIDQTGKGDTVQTWGKTTIAPLQRHGLLQSIPGEDEYLFHTKKGIVTYLVHMEKTERFYRDYLEQFYETEHGAQFVDLIRRIAQIT